MEQPLRKTAVAEQESVIDVVVGLGNTPTEINKRRLENKFYEIFRRDFWRLCAIVCRNYFRKSGEWEYKAKDVFLRSFERVMYNIKSGKFKLEFPCSEEQAYGKVRNYLGKTANYRIRELAASDKKQKGNLIDFIKHWEVESTLEEGISGKREVITSFDPIKVKLAWEKFCPLAEDIVRVSIEYDCIPRLNKDTGLIDKNTKQLPKELKAELIARHNTTDANYRKVKQRSIEAMMNCILIREETNPNSYESETR